jgi:hypothetical protein
MKWIQNLKLAWKNPKMRWAMLIAVISDALGFVAVLFPPAIWILDALTAIALLLVLGYRWKLLVALAIEVVPAIQLFPAWTLVILAIAATENNNELQEHNKS